METSQRLAPLAKNWSEYCHRLAQQTPPRVFRNQILCDYFITDFFHDAAVRMVTFDHLAQELIIDFVANQEIVPKYSRTCGIRLPKYKEGHHYFLWRCVFSHVTHFALNAHLSKVELMNGKVVSRNWAFHPVYRNFEYKSGRFISSHLLEQHQRNFKVNLFHLKMDCDTRTMDVIFKKVLVQRITKVPHRFKERKKYERYLRSLDIAFKG